MPKQGASSGFKYGRAVGAIEAAIMLCSIPVEIALFFKFAHLLGFSVGYSATVWVKYGHSNDLPCFHIVAVCLDGNQPAVLF